MISKIIDYLYYMQLIFAPNKIIKRDKVCAICKTTHNLEAHHLYDKNHYPRKALLLSNGVALCERHHHNFHISFMGGFDKKCTKQDFERYKLEYFGIKISFLNAIKLLFKRS